ncbi:MAG: hypothetical protein Tsb008_07630 [Rhodothalassiaceae bacterium]
MRDRTSGNIWHRRRTATPWPLAFDLSRRGGQAGRRTGAVLLLALLAGTGAIALFSPPPLLMVRETMATSDATADEDRRQLALAKSGDRDFSAAPTDLPSPLVEAQEEPAARTHAQPLEKRVEIRRGGTLIDALLAAGVASRDAYAAVTALGKIHDPRRLRAGQELSLRFDAAAEPTLMRLSMRTGPSMRVSAVREADGTYLAKREPLATNDVVAYAEGHIDDSLYIAAARAGVPASVIVEMIRLFSFNVDFQREIRPGDRFALLYRRALTEEDGEIENGDILYARLTLSGRDLALYRHRPIDDDRVEYFDAEGKTARKALMKTPLDGARLTSRYGSRKHPVLGYVRAHRGLDFGAPTGTPVYAAGDGIIERASRYGSYGNYVRIRHNGTYKTAYAHLSKYGPGIRQGVRVRQGDVIGYVGATGRVTGAHLHYEVLVKDEQVDPLRLKLPSGRTLEGPAREAFLAARAALDKDIEMLAQANGLMLAEAPNAPTAP